MRPVCQLMIFPHSIPLCHSVSVSPHLCFIIVFICDLFVSHDDPSMSEKTFMRTEQLYVLSHDRSRGRGWDPVKPV